MRAWLIKHGEIATNVSAVGAIFFGIVWLTGGTIPPWFTLAQAQTLQETVQKQQAEIASQVQRTADTLMRIVDKLNRDDCINANRRLNNARERVRQRPMDTVERGIYEDTLRALLNIPGCSIMPE